jgi:hypothetical protein
MGRLPRGAAFRSIEYGRDTCISEETYSWIIFPAPVPTCSIARGNRYPIRGCWKLAARNDDANDSHARLKKPSFSLSWRRSLVSVSMGTSRSHKGVKLDGRNRKLLTPAVSFPAYIERPVCKLAPHCFLRAGHSVALRARGISWFPYWRLS